ncbi:hypothetical protein ACFQQC_02180 [Brevundimonas sp. GCM10030266]
MAVHVARMDMRLTLILTAAFLALTLFAGWRGARPWDPSQRVRMAPWRFIMVMSGAVTVLLLIHIGALLGVPQRSI